MENQAPAAPKKRLIIWQIILVAAEQRQIEIVRQAVHGLNIAVEVETSITAAGVKCLARGSRLLAVSRASQAEDRRLQIVSLLALPGRQPYPLLLLGGCPEDELPALNSKFSRVLSIGEAVEIGEALAQTSTTHDAPRDEGPQATATAPHLRALFEGPIEISYAARESGRRYAGLKIEKLVDADTRMSSLEARAEFSSWCRRQTVKARAHMRRVLFSTAEMCDAIDFFSTGKESLTAASGLFGVSVERNDAPLLTGDYLQGGPEARNAFAQRVRRSAEGLQQVPGLAGAGRIVERMADLLTAQEPPAAEYEAQSASLLIGVDIMDRMCFSAGFWNPRAAQRLLKIFARNEIGCVSELALSGITKFLVNAFEGPLQPGSLERSSAQERWVRLSELQPGMRLSGPLHARDGAAVLAADNKLDAEMIWRLWSLAAVRPLCNPVSIRADIY